MYYMFGSFNKLLRNVASLKGKSAFDKVTKSVVINVISELDQGHLFRRRKGTEGETFDM